MGGRGARQVLPLRKRGVKKIFGHAEGGHKKFCGSFYTVVLAILKGGREKFTLFEKRGHKKFYPVLRGGAKSFGPAIFPFCSPPPHSHN